MVSPTSQKIPTAAVIIPPDVSRLWIDPERVAALADDFAVNGQLQEIGVAGPDADGKYLLGFGHRRLLAARLLDWPMLDAKAWPAGTSLLAIRAAENHMREQLTPIEEAHEAQRFIAAGEAHAAVARRYRRSIDWLMGRLDLLTLPPDLQEAVHRGDLAVTVANLLRAIAHDGYRASLTREAIERGASAPSVRVWVAHYEADRARIEQNHETIEHVAAERASYVIKYRCEACQREVPVTETSAFRVCRPCGQAIAATLAAEAGPQAAPQRA